MVSLQKGLVGHWTMDDSDTSSGTLYDSTGHSRNGEINGDLAISQSGRVQQSYDFGSSNAYVQTSYSATPSPISICCWYYPNANGEYHALASKIDGNTRSYEVLRNNSNGVRFHVSNDRVDSNRTDLTSGNWFHICCTWDGSEAEIIINSESDITDNTLTQRSNSTSWRIGASPRGENFADGKIDDVRLYNRVLSSNEISALYNMRSQRIQRDTLSQGLVGHWTLDTNTISNGIAYDSSGYGNTGNVQGGVTTINSSPIGEGLSFDGDFGSTVKTSLPNTSFNELTLAMWINLDGSFSKTFPDLFDAGWRVEINDQDTTKLSWYPETNDILFNVPNNEWHHIACTYNSNKKEVFLDATSVGVKPTKELLSTTSSVYLMSESGNKAVGGKLSDVRVYNRVLTNSEVSRLYNKR